MSNMIPEYSTVLFTDVWESANDFKTDFQASPFTGSLHYGETVSGVTYPDNVSLLYYLLYARYANNPLANYDTDQFKYKIYSIIFQYGPTWQKKLEIQSKLRALTDDELLAGSKAIYNSAVNPSTEPSTGTLEELEYINAQNTTNYKRGKLEGYGTLWELLNTDVTGAFLNKFRVCFKQFVRPEVRFIYESEDEGE